MTHFPAGQHPANPAGRRPATGARRALANRLPIHEADDAQPTQRCTIIMQFVETAHSLSSPDSLGGTECRRERPVRRETLPESARAAFGIPLANEWRPAVLNRPALFAHAVPGIVVDSQ